jgi:hypothetical protein
MSGVVVRTITPARNPIVPHGALFATGARSSPQRGTIMIAKSFYLIA